MERKTIHRCFTVWNFEKEERWLNSMAQSGWVLDGVGFCTYHFIACTPGAYTVRLEMHGPDEAYIDFMRETGAETIGRVFQWVFFRKKAEDGEFDLFSDLDSRIAHLARIGRMLAAVGGANLLIGLANLHGPGRLGWLNLLCVAALMYALGRIHGKKESLGEKRAI
ncbi:MAG: DUF2812 domain-containing protein, partial [Eubacteriales bacterium]